MIFSKVIVNAKILNIYFYTIQLTHFIKFLQRFRWNPVGFRACILEEFLKKAGKPWLNRKVKWKIPFFVTYCTAIVLGNAWNFQICQSSPAWMSRGRRDTKQWWHCSSIPPEWPLLSTRIQLHSDWGEPALGIKYEAVKINQGYVSPFSMHRLLQLSVSGQDQAPTRAEAFQQQSTSQRREWWRRLKYDMVHLQFSYEHMSRDLMEISVTKMKAAERYSGCCDSTL